jgi:hypothetical protein
LLVALLAAWIAVPSIAQDNAVQQVGYPTDWSSSHLIFTEGGDARSQLEAQRDPRYWMQQVRRNTPVWRQRAPQVASSGDSLAAAGEAIGRGQIPIVSRSRGEEFNTHLGQDWNFSLQATGSYGGVLYYRYPAKYSFAPIATASCANDYVIYVLNTGGSSTQANVIGVNNLYVGASGGCATITGPPTGGGSGSAPTPQVKWAFDTSSSVTSTSPVISLDGKKVAYIVNATPAVLQVLTLGSGSGTVAAPTTSFGACNTTGPSMCTITLGTGRTVNVSSPFVDYATDTGYFGDDQGHLYMVSNFFSVNGTAPAIVSGWPVSTGSASTSPIVGPPVYDPATGTVFVASADGKLYGFNASTKAQITGSPLTLATDFGTSGGNISYGIWEPPIVDSTNHVLYAFYGANAAGTHAEVAQVVYYDHSAATVEFKTSATAGIPGSTSTAVAGTILVSVLTTSANTVIIPDGAFSQSYFSGFSNSTSFLYTCGASSTSSPYGASLQQFTFNSALQLTGTVYNVNTISTSAGSPANVFCSPLAEFDNAGTDYLFLSVTSTPVSGSDFRSYDITNNTANGAMTPAHTYAVSGGSSGIIVDGADSMANASSIYFDSLVTGTCTTSGANGTQASPANSGIGSVSPSFCAIKLTQSGLQ